MSNYRKQSTYVDIDREEMEYVNGGGYVSLTLSTAFQIDCITAGLSTVGALIGLAIGNSVGCCIGAGLGWLVGGVIARNVTHNSIIVGGYVPFISGNFTL